MRIPFRIVGVVENGYPRLVGPNTASNAVRSAAPQSRASADPHLEGERARGSEVHRQHLGHGSRRRCRSAASSWMPCSMIATRVLDDQHHCSMGCGVRVLHRDHGPVRPRHSRHQPPAAGDRHPQDPGCHGARRRHHAADRFREARADREPDRVAVRLVRRLSVHGASSPCGARSRSGLSCSAS